LLSSATAVRVAAQSIHRAHQRIHNSRITNF
jgi:hypothetical protein